MVASEAELDPRAHQEARSMTQSVRMVSRCLNLVTPKINVNIVAKNYILTHSQKREKDWV